MLVSEIKTAKLVDLLQELGAAGEPSAGLSVARARDAVYLLNGVVWFNGKLFQVMFSRDRLSWSRSSYGRFCEEVTEEVAMGNEFGDIRVGSMFVRWSKIED